MRVRVFALPILLALTGCATERDDTGLLADALGRIERDQPIEVIVLGPNLSQQARKSASELHRVVEQSELNPVSGYDLPAGHFLLKAIEVSGNTAHVVGTLGPVPSRATLACGIHYDFSFSFQRGRWVPGDIEMMQC